MSITSDVAASAVSIEGKHGSLTFGEIYRSTAVATNTAGTVATVSLDTRSSALVTHVQGISGGPDGVGAATITVDGAAVTTSATTGTVTTLEATRDVKTNADTIVSTVQNAPDGAGTITLSGHGFVVSPNSTGSIHSDHAGNASSGLSIINTVTVHSTDTNKSIPAGLYIHGASDGVVVTVATATGANLTSGQKTTMTVSVGSGDSVSFTGTGSVTYTYITVDSNGETNDKITSDKAVSSLGRIKSVSGYVAAGSNTPSPAVTIPTGSLVVGASATSTATETATLDVNNVAVTGAIGTKIGAASNFTAPGAVDLSANAVGTVGFTVFYVL